MKIYSVYRNIIESADVKERKTTYKALEPTGLGFGCRTVFNKNEVSLTPKEAVEREIKKLISRKEEHLMRIGITNYDIECAEKLLEEISKCDSQEA